MLHISKPQPTVNPTPTPNPTGAENPILAPPDVTVKMILKSRNGNIALINGRRYRVGDPIGIDGWVVDSINAAARSVVVVLPETGRQATLSVPLPSSR